MSRERIRGKRAGNLERAIAIYNVTFTLYTPEPISEGLGEQAVLAPLIQPKALPRYGKGQLWPMPSSVTQLPGRQLAANIAGICSWVDAAQRSPPPPRERAALS
jgi:hypothetical protein